MPIASDPAYGAPADVSAPTTMSLDDVFNVTDALGPARVIHVSEPTLGLKAVLVIDNVGRGPSIGGLRMAPDVSTTECVSQGR